MLLQDEKKPSLCYADVLSMGFYIYIFARGCVRGRKATIVRRRREEVLLSVSTLLQESHLARSWGLSNLHKHKTHREVQRCKKLVLIFGKSTCITIKDGLKDELWFWWIGAITERFCQSSHQWKCFCKTPTYLSMVGSIILKTKIAEMVLNLVMILVTGEWRSWCQEQGTTLFAGSSADKVLKKLRSDGYCQISNLRSNWAGTLWHFLADFNKFAKLHLLTVHKCPKFFSK